MRAVQVLDFTHDAQTQPDRPFELDLVGQTIGSFKVQRLLGEGGAGAVYLAEHTEIGTRVAIKVLTGTAAQSPDFRARLVREARATNSINSPHVPRYFDFGQLDDGRAYTTIEYFEGETLHAYMTRRRGMLSIGEVTDLLLQLADGMAAAHAADVVHRDLKPENIFLVRQRNSRLHVIILDFGVAKLLGPRTAVDGNATTAGTFLGTPLYCAPEQAFGAAVTPASDVYSLGVIAYELLSGRLPHDGANLESLAKKVSTDAPSLAIYRADLPAAIVDDVAAMLARDPGKRLQTMDELRKRLERWVTHAAPFDAPTIAAHRVTIDDGDTRVEPVARPPAPLPMWRQPRAIAITLASLALGFGMSQLIV